MGTRLVPSPVTIVKVAAALFVAGLSFYLPQSALNSANSKTVPAKAVEAMDVWWPVEGAKVKDTQPFKALLPNRNVQDYTMSWQVDGDRMNPMESNYEAWPHKEAAVDLRGWNWKGAGPYRITFSAKDNSGKLLSERSVNIWIDGATVPAVTETAPAPIAQPEPQVELAIASPGPAVVSEPSATEPTQPISQPAAISQPEPAAQTAPSEPVKAETLPITVVAAASQPPVMKAVEVWWPVDGANVSGLQPFKGLLKDAQLWEYDMFWQVDGGGLNPMPDNWADYPHKETMTELSGWNWKGSGPYAVKFVAKNKQGQTVGEKTVNITVGSTAPKTTTTTPAPTPAATPAPEPTTTQTTVVQPVSTGAATAQGNPFTGAKLYVNPYGDALKQAQEWRASRPNDASLMDKLGAQPESFWMGGWNKDIRADAAKMVQAAEGQGALPVFVAYNIPNRDCGQHSAGGVANADAYRTWIRGLADGIGSRKAAVIIEPDALTLTDCLSAEQKAERFGLIKDAVNTFKSKGNIAVYLDAGHARWIDATEMANRLKNAGIDKANGFALNISNFITDSESIAYGEKISAKTGGKHFVIDSGRNGNGTNGEWCNPWGRALGRKPTAATGSTLVDAFLWVKGPGGSDGWCNGGPSAGTWFPEYALQLVKNANW